MYKRTVVLSFVTKNSELLFLEIFSEFISKQTREVISTNEIDAARIGLVYCPL